MRGQRLKLQHKMFVGTFHKTGTILMWSIIQKLSHRFGLRLWVQNSRPAPPRWDVCFDAHSHFRYGVRELPHKGFIVIRDPRDIVISGAYYHARLKPGTRDGWVHLPEERFGGLSYQEKIRSLGSDHEKFVFEMDNMAVWTIRKMRRWIEPPPEFLVLRFEDLVTDPEMREFARAFAWLGVPPDRMAEALEIARGASLFSGPQDATHVRSGQPEQWRAHFTPELHAEFSKRFGRVAEHLGYLPR